MKSYSIHFLCFINFFWQSPGSLKEGDSISKSIDEPSFKMSVLNAAAFRHMFPTTWVILCSHYLEPYFPLSHILDFVKALFSAKLSFFALRFFVHFC